MLRLWHSLLRAHDSLVWQAYVMVEIQTPQGRALPGFERGNFSVLANVRGAQLPLHWGESRDSSALAGQLVRLRVCMRDATVFGLNA